MPDVAPYTLPFGKYRGWPLQNVPLDYLAWLLTQKLARALRASAEAEIARREQMAGPALLPPPARHPDLAVAPIVVALREALSLAAAWARSGRDGTPVLGVIHSRLISTRS